ncbi:MAG: cytochrome c [Rhodothermaceae bacterium]|nr:MAG: cytochrome c [Rhodothermaceae bacterium]
MKRVSPFSCLPLLCLLVACGTSPGERSPASSSAVPAFLNHAPEAAYVGKEVCGTCHPDKYETFVRSQMGRSFKPATLQNSAADFENARPVYDPHNDLYYRPFHRGDSLYIMEYRLAGRDTVHKRIEKIDYIIGSGQHTNSHIMEVNGYLYQMPLTWYAQDGKWDLPPKFAGGNNARFSRPIPVQCMTCHNAMPGFVEGSENRFSHVPDGIDCERCHGPGSVHVEAMRAGRAVDVTREIDRTIVNPAKLPVERQFDVCQRCHMQGAAVWKQSPMAFRPGMRLADFENVFWPRFADSTHQFIMASHPDRLKMSECFIQTQRRPDPDRGSLTCITCHDPHVPIETMEADHYNQVCQSCHTAPKAATCSEDAAVRARAADNCAGCHMPVSGSIDIPHVRITDHFIRAVRRDEVEILSAEEDLDRRRLVRMAGLIDPRTTAGRGGRGVSDLL